MSEEKQPEIKGRLVIEYAPGFGVRHNLEGEFPPTELVMALEVIKAAIVAEQVQGILLRKRAEQARKVQLAPKSPFGG
jgi:hypothetical protein